MKNKDKPTTIDLFSGCGGLSLGFLKSNFKIVGAIDYDKDACKTYRKNLGDKVQHIFTWDLFEKVPEDFFDETGLKPSEVDVVIGGPPCRGFSIAGNREEEDERNNLVDVFLDWVKFVSPEAVLMENVPGIKTMYGGKAAEHVREKLRSDGYNENLKVLNTAEFGVPQVRERAIFLGQKNKKPSYPEPTHEREDQISSHSNLKPAVTVGEAIADLPPLSAGESSNTPNHEARNHGKEQVEKMSYINPGENWESLPEKYRKGKNYPSHAYHRLNPNKPSRILPANASSTSILHPEDDRQITVREFARLQSFPDDFVFFGKKSSRYRQVGDAVPPLLAERLAAELKNI